jgi:hypothetical protein
VRGRWRLALGLAVLVAVGVAAALYFRPAPPPVVVGNRAFASAPAGPATVWAVGDGADGGERAKRLVARIADDHPARLLYLGDVYERGTAGDFAGNYASTYGRLASITAPTPGNHDWPRHPEGYDPYWRGVTGATTPPWYAFSVAGWQVLALNSEAPHDAGSEQVAWLRTQLTDDGTCRLAFWHRAYLSDGRHGDQHDVAPLWDQLRGRAALVLNGHDHDTQRFKAVDSITELVAGAGGKSFYGVDASDPRLAFADDHTVAAVRLALRPGGADVAVVAADGRVLDRSSVTCRPLPGRSG